MHAVPLYVLLDDIPNIEPQDSSACHAYASTSLEASGAPLYDEVLSQHIRIKYRPLRLFPQLRHRRSASHPRDHQRSCSFFPQTPATISPAFGLKRVTPGAFPPRTFFWIIVARGRCTIYILSHRPYAITSRCVTHSVPLILPVIIADRLLLVNEYGPLSGQPHQHLSTTRTVHECPCGQ